jgi:Domain of unknown function (DUF6901)
LTGWDPEATLASAHSSPIAVPMAPRDSRRRTLRYTYSFGFADGARKEFEVSLDHATLQVVPREERPLPHWTALGYQKCGNCPLSEIDSPRCPVAVNMVEVVEFFRESRSYETADVRVRGQGREYSKRTSLQQAVSSLLGIFMVTSGCPVMNRLRPMVDTHLPFMDPDESTYRTLSMYLTAQFFRSRGGKPPDWKLERLVPILDECRETNRGFCLRLKSLGIADASLNALSTLNALGEITSLSLETEDLERWSRIFLAHYGDD